MIKYTIYQLPAEHKNCFRRWEDHDVKLEDYKPVFDGYISGNDSMEILDLLFTLFNKGDYPSNYNGRSISVSDVIVLDKFGTYFCDSFGWKKIK